MKEILGNQRSESPAGTRAKTGEWFLPIMKFQHNWITSLVIAACGLVGSAFGSVINGGDSLTGTTLDTSKWDIMSGTSGVDFVPTSSGLMFVAGGPVLVWKTSLSTTQGFVGTVDLHLTGGNVLGLIIGDFTVGHIAQFHLGNSAASIKSFETVFQGPPGGSTQPSATTISAITLGPGAFGWTPYSNEYDVDVAAPGVTDATLRFNYEPSSHILSLDYDSNGAVGGYAWTNLCSINAFNGWDMSTTSSFGVALTGNGGAIQGDTYLINFSITAIPEPSTYGALAGVVALGFALRGRRKMADDGGLPE